MIDTGKEGAKRLYAYCRILKDFLVAKEIVFDYLVSGGNSGIAMSEIALIVYDELKLPRPLTVRTPFYRYLPNHRDEEQFRFNHTIYFDAIKNQLTHTRSPENILFVDDEISQGNTALGMYNLMERSLLEQGMKSDFKYYITAEDQGFTPPANNDRIFFSPFAKEIDGFNNLIFCVVPYNFERPIIECFSNDSKFSFHKRTNLLLDLPIKDFNNGKPIYTTAPLEKAKKNISNFVGLQNEFRKYLTHEIHKALI